MSKKGLNKAIAMIMLIILTSVNIIAIGAFVSETYANGVELEKQGIATNNADIDFDAFFVKNENELTHSIVGDINNLNTNIYLYVNVKNSGYLKNGLITLSNGSNFKFDNTKREGLLSTEKLEEAAIKLEQIDAGNQAKLEIPIKSTKNNQFDLRDFNKDTTIKLVGTFVDKNGKEHSIEKDIIVNVGYTGLLESQLEQEIVRFIPYNIDNKKGIIVQTSIVSGLKDNTLPIASTKIQTTGFTINGIKPIEVNVDLDSSNWNYDKESNLVKIQTENKVIENKVNWNKEKTENIITYIFDEEALATIKESNVKFDVNTISSIDVYNNNGIETLNKELKKELSVTEQISQIVTYEISTNTQNISKGYMYANLNKEMYETEYQTTWKANVSYPKIIDSLLFSQNADKFILANGSEGSTTIANNNITKYKQTTISKQNFDKILGEDGFIKIYNSKNELFALINKDLELVDGNYEFNYDGIDINNIKIETSKPLAEGTLEINHVKVIKSKILYGKTQVEDFISLDSNLVGKAINKETNIVEEEKVQKITLDETITKVDFEVSNTNFSTVIENKNVELKAVLRTDSTRYDLFKNPIIEIELPSYVEDITINEINLLYDEELKIQDVSKRRIANGNLVVKIMLQGNQTNYNIGSITKGSNLVINSNIKIKELVATNDSEIKFTYTNEKANAFESNSQIIPVKIIAPEGIVTINKISNFNSLNQTAVSINDKEEFGKLEIKKQSKIATVTLAIINNNQKASKNVKILGRTPFKGNKSLEDDKDLGTTFDAVVKSKLRAQGIPEENFDVYYSENGNANNNLNDTLNKWTKEIDMTKVKSYLVVFKNYDMPVGKQIIFEYDIEIPADLEFNQSTYGTYMVYYDNDRDEIVTPERVISPIVGVRTGDGPNLDIKLESSVPEAIKIRERESVTYTVTIKNKGTTNAEDVVVKIPVPKGLEVKDNKDQAEVILNIGTILGGKSTDKSVEFIAKKISVTLPDDGDDDDENDPEPVKEDYILDVEGKAFVSAKNLDIQMESNKVKNTIIKADFTINADVNGYISETQLVTYPIVKIGNKLLYRANFQNVEFNSLENETALTNLEVKTILPIGLKYISAKSSVDNGTAGEIKYDEQSRTLTFKFASANAFATAKVEILTEVVEIPNETATDINVQFKINADNLEESKSKVLTSRYERELVSNLVYTFTSNVPEGKVYYKDVIEYKLVLENKGTVTINEILVKDTLPSGLMYEGSSYTKDGEKIEAYNNTNGTTQLKLKLAPGEKLELIVKAKVLALKNDTLVENFMTITGAGGQESKTNTLKHTIVATEEGGGEGEVPVPGTYRVAGTAWIDENKDGKKDTTEKLLPNVKVLLLKADTSEKLKETTTDGNGNYSFINLVDKEEYLVIFLYDAGEYNLTTYKKEGIDETDNSDVIASKLNLEGNIIEVAVTDKLKIDKANIYNVNIGVFTNPKFDLQLDKYVSKVTTQTSKGTSSFDYNNTKLAKVDLDGKLINSTTVLIEYKIVISNKGAVAGYVKKFADYMAKDLTFNSSLNPDWYLGSDGILYNVSVANTKLEPGESKEFKLILSKKMNEDNTGIVNNTAEIIEDYNDLGLKDYNSTPGNKIQDENDMSSADTLVTIKTGSALLYISITLAIIAIIGLGAYIINKKVLRGKN